MREAAQCERYIPNSVLVYDIAHQSIAPGSFKFTVDVTVDGCRKSR